MASDEVTEEFGDAEPWEERRAREWLGAYDGYDCPEAHHATKARSLAALLREADRAAYYQGYADGCRSEREPEHPTEPTTRVRFNVIVDVDGNWTCMGTGSPKAPDGQPHHVVPVEADVPLPTPAATVRGKVES